MLTDLQSRTSTELPPKRRLSKKVSTPRPSVQNTTLFTEASTTGSASRPTSSTAHPPITTHASFRASSRISGTTASSRSARQASPSAPSRTTSPSSPIASSRASAQYATTRAPVVTSAMPVVPALTPSSPIAIVMALSRISVPLDGSSTRTASSTARRPSVARRSTCT